MSTNTAIHVGFWTNWSHGPVLGSTLTLSKSNGAILVAALAIFIRLIGGQSWNIICFAVHQLRTTTQARDGMHHQQQATLRNNTSDITTLWQFVKIGWAWRNFRRSMAPLFIGTFHLIAFGAASILAARITTVGDQVLVARSPSCGPWGPSNQGGISSTPELNIAHQSYLTTTLESSREYVLNCIQQSQSLPECDAFNNLQLNWTSTNVLCPFGELCLGPADGALYMETGLLDSRDDFGINAHDKDRVGVRRNATCIPITTEGYTTNGTSRFGPAESLPIDNIDVSGVAFNYTALFYGPTDENLTAAGLADPAIQNITYIYTNFRDIATEFWNYERSPYDVHVEDADYNHGFLPLPAFSATNKTLSLIFASYYGNYMAPSDDLWLAAHQLDTQLLSSAEASEGTAEEDVFMLDHPVSVLACTEQYQICNPSPLSNATSACTPWLSGSRIFDATRDEISVLNTDRQWNTSQTLVQSIVHGDFYSTIFFLASPQLLADSLTSGDGVSLPLASDQWILEAKNFFTIGLANTQRLVVETITGPPSQFTQYALNETEVNEYPSLVWLCESLIIRRSDFTNFSTLAISLIFGLGVLIIGTSLCLETVVGLVRSKWRRNRWRQRAWWAEGTLQLQRRAFEGMGIKGWEFGEWEKVPLMGDKGRVWSALGNWDEMLPFVEGKKIQGKMAGEKMAATSSIQEFTTLSQQNSGTGVSPVTSNSESHRDAKRLRSNSV